MEHRIFHIVAASGDVISGQGVIGDKNKLPWPKYPADMKFFKEITMGHTVMMGSNTFEGIGGRPLPGRENIVLSRSSDFKAPDGVKVFHSVEEGVRNSSNRKVFIIGGGEVYRQTLKMAEGIFLTPIERLYDGDAKYPPLSPEIFQKDKEESDALQEKFKIPIVYFRNKMIQRSIPP